MSSLNDLPIEVLGIIFRYLEQEAIQEHMLQYRLTCKKWNKIAHLKMYRRVTLKSIDQVSRFIHALITTNRGSLVKYIKFAFTDSREVTFIIWLWKVADVCTNLRMFVTEHEDEYIWEIIEMERKNNGRFLKLEAIPSINGQAFTNLVERYNSAAYSLRYSLRELTVYESDSIVPLQNEIIVSHFKKVECIHFRFGDCSDLYTTDFRVKECPSIQLIDITCKGRLQRENVLADTSKRTIYVLPHIKRLRLRVIPFEDYMYTYIMQVFSNLERIFWEFIPDPDLSLPTVIKPVTTHVAIQFLRFLIEIPVYIVRYLPLKNVDDVLLGFGDNKNIIKSLHIIYDQGTQVKFLPYMSLSTYIEVFKTVKLKVYYTQNTPYMLPRLGLIERSGINIQRLRIDMGVEHQYEETTVKGLSNSITILDILYQCPNLRRIDIYRTLLYNPISKTQLPERLLSCNYIYLSESFTYHSFLTMLSSRISYIGEFTIHDCTFVAHTSISIDMSDTTFDQIVIKGYSGVDLVYLKLEMMEKNSVIWYLGTEKGYEKCTESMYETFVQNKENMSLFIRCKDVRTVSINGFKITA